MKKFFRKIVISIKRKLKFLLFPYILFLLKTKNYKNINELLDFILDTKGGVLIASQVREEISGLLKIIEKQKPKIILEIGTQEGGTLFLFSRLSSCDATIISIDLPKGNFGGGYSKWKIPLFKNFTYPKQKLFLIRKNSHNLETLEKIREILKGKNIDFLFIDGDHSYNGVKSDFKMYSGLVNKGIIAFHDIVPGLARKVGGVPKFWKEIKNKYPSKEIVKDWQQGGRGIGILEKK